MKWQRKKSSKDSLETAAVVRVPLLEQKLGKTTWKTLILHDAEKLRRAKETVRTLFAKYQEETTVIIIIRHVANVFKFTIECEIILLQLETKNLQVSFVVLPPF